MPSNPIIFSLREFVLVEVNKILLEAGHELAEQAESVKPRVERSGTLGSRCR